VNFLEHALLVLHFVGIAAIVGPTLGQLKSDTKHITTVMVWGARAQILTGLALVGVISAGDNDLKPAWIAVKFLVALAIVGISEATRKKGAVAWAFWAVFGLSLVNITVAVFWH